MQVCLLAKICDLQINHPDRSLAGVLCGENLSSWCTHPQLQADKVTSACFSSHMVKRCPCVIHLMSGLSQFCIFCWWFHCLKWLRSVLVKFCLGLPQFMKALKCFMDEPMLGKLYSGLSDRAVGHEINVNESTMH